MEKSKLRSQYRKITGKYLEPSFLTQMTDLIRDGEKVHGDGYVVKRHGDSNGNIVWKIVTPWKDIIYPITNKRRLEIIGFWNSKNEYRF